MTSDLTFLNVIYVRCCYTEILLVWLMWVLILTLLEQCLPLGEDSKQYSRWLMEAIFQSGGRRGNANYGAGSSIPLGCVLEWVDASNLLGQSQI